jgi:DNA-binding CsgD family transcriptional regulator
MAKTNKVRVRFAVEDDEQANKITALLEALGYEVIREIEHGSAQTRLRWAVTRLSSRAKLTEREREILQRVLQGRHNGEIGEELGIRKATVKWHMHNIFTKTGARTREGLLREALQLGGGARREPPPRGDDRELSSTQTLADDDDDA